MSASLKTVCQEKSKFSETPLWMEKVLGAMKILVAKIAQTITFLMRLEMNALIQLAHQTQSNIRMVLAKSAQTSMDLMRILKLSASKSLAKITRSFRDPMVSAVSAISTTIQMRIKKSASRTFAMPSRF